MDLDSFFALAWNAAFPRLRFQASWAWLWLAQWNPQLQKRAVGWSCVPVAYPILVSYFNGHSNRYGDTSFVAVAIEFVWEYDMIWYDMVSHNWAINHCCPNFFHSHISYFPTFYGCLGSILCLFGRQLRCCQPWITCRLPRPAPQMHRRRLGFFFLVQGMSQKNMGWTLQILIFMGKMMITLWW